MANELKKVTYIKSDGEEYPIDIIEVGELIIIQDIFTPQLQGELTISDRDFWQNILPTLGDKLEVVIEKPILPKSKDDLYEKIQPDYQTYTFDVYKGVQMPIDMSKKPYRDVCVYFTAGNMLRAYTTPVSKSFNHKTFKQIATDLFNTVDVSVKFHDEYDKVLNYTTPMWTPIKTLTDITSYAVTKGEKAGVMMFQTLDGKLNFISTQELFNGKMGEYDNTETYIDSMNQMVEENHALGSSNKNFNKVITMQFTKIPNYMKMANKGYFNSTFTYYELESNTLDTYTRNIKSINNKGNKLSKFLNVNPEHFGNYTTNNTHISPCGGCKEYHKGYMDTKMSRMLFDMYEIKIGVMGYIDRRIGQLIKIDVPNQVAVNRKNEEYFTADDTYTGTFLIRSIKHNFTSDSYTQEIVAVTDGINSDEHTGNLVEWRNNNKDIT